MFVFLNNDFAPGCYWGFMHKLMLWLLLQCLNYPFVNGTHSDLVYRAIRIIKLAQHFVPGEGIINMQITESVAIPQSFIQRAHL